MFSILKKIFSRNTPKKHHAVILKATPEKDNSLDKVSQVGEDIIVDLIPNVPTWYEDRGHFDDIEFSIPNQDLVVPEIRDGSRVALMKYVSSVCPEPDGSIQIYNKLNNPDASIKEISSLVSSDPMLASRVLKVVNSAAYGFSNEITSIGRAITLLGFQNIRAIVLHHAVKKGVTSVQSESSLAIREHSRMCSAVAYHIATTVPGVDNFSASTIGLLNDMGKILYPMLVDSGKGINFSKEIPMQVVESLIASTFAQIWKLPTTICKVLEFSNYPYFYDMTSIEKPYLPLVTVISMAKLYSNAMGFSDGDPLYPVRTEYLENIRKKDSPAHWVNEKGAVNIETMRGLFKV